MAVFDAVTIPKYARLMGDSLLNVPKLHTHCFRAEDLIQRGKVGSAPSELSRAEKHLLVVGKSDQPLLRNSPTGVCTIETYINVDTRERILETELASWRMITALRM